MPPSETDRPHTCFVQRAIGGLIDERWCSNAHLATLRELTPGSVPVVDDPRLGLFSDDRLTIRFAPFDSSNPGAKVVFVGLTPGDAQRRIALSETAMALREGDTLDVVLRRAKNVAAFAGAMRTNLIAMLDGIGLPVALGILSGQQLFGDRRELADSTSAICHPVFRQGRNYSGTPRISSHPVLAAAARQVLAANLAESPEALIVPLGRAATEGVTLSGADPMRVLIGFPHPSGANGGRAAQFRLNQAEMTRKVGSWFGSSNV